MGCCCDLHVGVLDDRCMGLYDMKGSVFECRECVLCTGQWLYR